MAMICSTGTATPQSGTYHIGYKWEWLGLFGDVFGYYVTQIHGNILFHSVPYLEKYNPASLEYWEFDKLGTNASLGCIRLQVKDAIWIYNHAEDIAAVEFYNAEDPGPLGKPSGPLISENEICRNWDPTDPNPENPWHAYYAENPPVEEVDPETGLPADPEMESDLSEGENGEAGPDETGKTESPTPEPEGEEAERPTTETEPGEAPEAAERESVPTEGTPAPETEGSAPVEEIAAAEPADTTIT
jgi:hypothetical protein